MTENVHAKPSAFRCRHCTHYYVTYDMNFRHGCRALGFKGKTLPEQAVLEGSGMACLAFQPKMERGTGRLENR